MAYLRSKSSENRVKASVGAKTRSGRRLFCVKLSAGRGVLEKYLTKYSHNFRKSTGKLHTRCGIIKTQEHKSLRRMSEIGISVFPRRKGRRREEVTNMKIIVTGKNIAISEKIQDAIDKKFEKLGKYFADDIQAKVIIHPEKSKVKMEATIVTKGTIFRAEDVSQDVFDCIDIVADKLLKQLTKYKGKLMKRNKSKESVRFEMLPEIEPADSGELVKTKKFELAPMTTEEAIMQMEMLQHNFFVFLDAETNTVNVVYKRNDEDYGLLETNH